MLCNAVATLCVVVSLSETRSRLNCRIPNYWFHRSYMLFPALPPSLFFFRNYKGSCSCCRHEQQLPPTKLQQCECCCCDRSILDHASVSDQEDVAMGTHGSWYTKYCASAGCSS
mmetsp:Transcript_40020/g.76742  ORF Transcript_40020/g.76742 Transcript_40020/m.76742 type:complete len:114 (-) Transcript_40020:74-415(-)